MTIPLYETISNEIMEQIHSGQLKENDKLSERNLALDYGVSRTVVRDALKLLNEKGYLLTQAGKGHYVKLPGESDFRGKVGNIITNSAIPFEAIVEARELIERAMVELILERITKEEIEELENLYLQMNEVIDNREQFSLIDQSFHVKIMSSSRNEMLLFFIQTLNDTTNRSNFLLGKEIRINAQKEHRNMLDSIKKKDQDKLKSAFYKHICCILEHAQ